MNSLKERGGLEVTNLEKKSKAHTGKPVNRENQLTNDIILTIASSAFRQDGTGLGRSPAGKNRQNLERTKGFYLTFGRCGGT